MNEQYLKYLQSEAWRRKRIARLDFDHNECTICGNKRNLDVHHVNYDNIFKEDIYRDLRTLCRDCHEKIEKEKRKTPPTETQKAYVATQAMTFDFCVINEKNDLSAGGNIDLCKNDVIRPMLYKFLRERGNNAQLMSVKQVNDYFRDKRYEVMEALFAENPTISAWQMSEKTGFKYQMVDRFLKRKRRSEVGGV